MASTVNEQKTPGLEGALLDWIWMDNSEVWTMDNAVACWMEDVEEERWRDRPEALEKWIRRCAEKHDQVLRGVQEGKPLCAGWDSAVASLVVKL